MINSDSLEVEVSSVGEIIGEVSSLNQIEGELNNTSAVISDGVKLQEKSVTPSTKQQSISPDASYDGLGKVVVEAVTSSIDPDIKASNIKKGIDILGVVGTVEEYTEPVLQTKSVTPKTSSQTIKPDSNYDGLSSVTVSAVTSSIDSDIVAGNIKKGVNILGVTGTLEEGTTPTGTKEITENGTYDVTNYASANVNVPTSGGSTDAELINSFISCIDNSSCANVTKLPEGLTEIKHSAFYNCPNMPLAELPSTITAIGDSAFENCKSLAITEIPSEVTSIGGYAFAYCKNLTILDIKSTNLTSIGESCFEGCENLEKIIFRASTPPTFGSNFLVETPIIFGEGYVYVPDASIEAYKNAGCPSHTVKGISELA